MTPHGINLVTRWLVLGPFLAWGVWEVVLLYLRTRLGTDVLLISQEARRLAYRGLPAFAYFLAGLSVHFFVNWTRPTWDGPIASALGATWWGIGFAYLVADVLDPQRTYWPLLTQWIRWPPVVALVGAALAFFAFPQRAMWTPGGPP